MFLHRLSGPAAAFAIAAISISLGGCQTTQGGVQRVDPKTGVVHTEIPTHRAQLRDGSWHVTVNNIDEGLTISGQQTSTYHCNPKCAPTGGGMTGSSGASGMISSAINAVGGHFANNGGGGVSATFNNDVRNSNKNSVKSSNAGIGNSNAAVIGSGNSLNVNTNANSANNFNKGTSNAKSN